MPDPTYTLVFNEGNPISMTVNEPDTFTFDLVFGSTAEHYIGDTEVTPNENEQTLSTAGLLVDADITIHGVDSGYIGSGVPRNDSGDLSVSGDTVSVPVGYYGEAASASVQTGSTGTPVATKGAVNNHSITITPSVTNTTGYIAGGTVTGAAVSVNAGELVSGSQTVTSNQTVNATNLAEVVVAVPTPSPVLQNKTKSYTPTESAQGESVTADAGYDGLGTVSVSVDAISSTYIGSGITQRDSSDLTASGATVTAPAGYYANNATKTASSGAATPAASISATGATVSTGTNTLTLSKTVSNTPQVSAGYISSGTAGNSSVTLTASVTTQAAQTIHPSTNDQTIASGRYLTGAQTVNAVTHNLSADVIKDGVVVEIGDSSDSDCVASVTGSYTGGGGSSKNVQIAAGMNRVASTSYTVVSGQSFSVAKTGVYDVYWTGYRTTTSGTSGSQLYVGSAPYGSAVTSFSSNGQSVHLSNVSLTSGQSVAVYARSRSTSYYMYAGNLTIIEA